MPTRHIPNALEQRTMALYAIDLFESITNMQLIDFLSYTRVMNYYDLQAALHNLNENGLVTSRPVLADNLYSLTEEGKQALDLYKQRCAQSFLDEMDAACQKFRESYQRQREYTTLVSHEGEKEYHALMQINEGEHSLLQLDISLPTATMAKELCDRWQDRAQEVYESVLRILSEDRNEG